MKTLFTLTNANVKRALFNDEAFKKLEELSEVDYVEEGKPFTGEDLERVIADYDACITCWGSPKFTPRILEKAKKLKFIGHAAGSVASLVDESVFHMGITVTSANTPMSYSTSELAFTLIMAGAWNLHQYNLGIKEGKWTKGNHDMVMGVSGQKIGIIGLGEISTRLIGLLKPFNAKITVHSNHCTPEHAASLGVELGSIEDILQNSQIISLHSALTNSTKGMLGKKHLDMIRDGALFVNTARAHIIEENAFIESLKEERYFAAIDVFYQEPTPENYEIINLPNVFCVPHIGGFGSYWKTRYGLYVVEDMQKWLKGEQLLGQVSLTKFKNATINL